MMEKAIKQRLLGGLVLVAGAALFLPVLLDGSGAALTIPPMPKAPDVGGVEAMAPRLDQKVADADKAIDAAHAGRDEAGTPPGTDAPAVPAGDVAPDAAAMAAGEGGRAPGSTSRSDGVATKSAELSRPAVAAAAAGAVAAAVAAKSAMTHSAAQATASPSGASLPATATPATSSKVAADAAAQARSLAAEKAAAEKAAAERAAAEKAAAARVVADKHAAEEKAAAAKHAAAEKAAAEKQAAAQKLATQKASDKASASAPEAWIVQVASLSSRDKAEALVQRLRHKGYPAVLHPQGGMFKVQVGPELNRAVADSIKSRMAADPELKLSGWVQAYKP